MLESYTMSYFAIYLMLRTAKKKKTKNRTKTIRVLHFFHLKNEIIKQSCSDRKKNVIELVRLNCIFNNKIVL